MNFKLQRRIEEEEKVLGILCIAWWFIDLYSLLAELLVTVSSIKLFGSSASLNRANKLFGKKDSTSKWWWFEWDRIIYIKGCEKGEMILKFQHFYQLNEENQVRVNSSNNIFLIGFCAK